MIWLTDKIEFPPYEFTTEDGIIALGGDLTSERLIYAYKNGIFPWYCEGEPIVWYSPPKRMVLFPDDLKVSKSMRNFIKNNEFEITENTAFEEVIYNCKNIDRKDEFGTWITDEMEQAYINLYKKGIAKSIEVWRFLDCTRNEKELVGGLYGLEINNIFCGESMFSKVSNTSKLAFIYLVKNKNYKLIDCQIYNHHLASLGAREIDRKDFLEILKIEKKKKQPWPTKDVMNQIYEQHLWGTNHTKFYSGFGSHYPVIVNPYLQVVSTFLESFKEKLTVLDLGCGDFNIGKNLVQYSKKYIGIDIVESLIHYNKKKFSQDILEFKCLNISTDKLPKADCVLIRQVLQHLSNKEIAEVVAKLYNYKYIIITEHLPNEEFIANKDIISGQGIRLKKNSGVNIIEPPFNFKVKNKREVLSIDLGTKKGKIVTSLFEVF